VKIILEDFSPEPGLPVLAGDKPVGTMGSTSGNRGLALIRTDRVSEALDAGLKLTAGGLPIRIAEPDELRGAPKQTVA
jgi:folate-binding Fe-S cluster repair protein YgfZ